MKSEQKKDFVVACKSLLLGSATLLPAVIAEFLYENDKAQYSSKKDTKEGKPLLVTCGYSADTLSCKLRLLSVCLSPTRSTFFSLSLPFLPSPLFILPSLSAPSLSHCFLAIYTAWCSEIVGAQWPIGYGVGLRIKRSSVRIRP